MIISFLNKHTHEQEHVNDHVMTCLSSKLIFVQYKWSHLSLSQAYMNIKNRDHVILISQLLYKYKECPEIWILSKPNNVVGKHMSDLLNGPKSSLHFEHKDGSIDVYLPSKDHRINETRKFHISNTKLQKRRLKHNSAKKTTIV